jgi:hypothetical protein
MAGDGGNGRIVMWQNRGKWRMEEDGRGWRWMKEDGERWRRKMEDGGGWRRME